MLSTTGPNHGSGGRATCKGDASESDVGDRARDTNQVVEGSLMIDVAPIGTRLDKCQLLLGVDADRS